MNLFDLKGPDFLIVYIVLLGIFVVAGILIRQFFYSRVENHFDPTTKQLNPYEVAYLAGGQKLALNAALTSLLHQKLVNFDTVNGKIAIAGPLPASAPSLEKQLYDHVAGGDPGISVRDLLRSNEYEATAIQEKLETHGLLLPSSQVALARWIPMLLMVALLVLGGIRIVQGFANHHPTSYLFGLVFFTLLITLLGFNRKLTRSPHGDALLQSMKADQAALQSNCHSNPSGLQASDLVLGLGLFGMGIMTTGLYGDLRKAIAPQGSGSSCGSGCGSGSSCSGGGGCGGGGCGGCGGGGD